MPGGQVAAVAVALSLLVVVIALSGVVTDGGGASARAGAASGPSDQATASVVVEPGETAWEALGPHRPAGVHHAVFVHEVLRFNDVEARELRPGDVLRVPRPPAS